MAARYCWTNFFSTLCKHVPCNTLTHSTNEDLLNIKRKCDPEVLYPLSYVRYHWNLEPVCKKSHFVSLFYLYWYFKIYEISSDILTRISTLFDALGWAWNCQIIFSFASIHGRACFILLQNIIYVIKFYLNGILNFFQYF